MYDNVYEHLNLEEREYFGLNFYDKSDNLVSAWYRGVVLLQLKIIGLTVLSDIILEVILDALEKKLDSWETHPSVLLSTYTV